MHRILNIAGNENNSVDLIEQPPADCIFLTSVKADLNLIASIVDENNDYFKNNIRCINIAYLKTNTQVDHYIKKTISNAKIVVVRLFGDKGTWSYGLEQLDLWSKLNKNKKLVVLSGTSEQDLELNELSNINLSLSIKLSFLLRQGGRDNYLKFIKCLNFIIQDKKIPKIYLNHKSFPDPFFYDWVEEEGPKVGIISYKSLHLADE